MINLKTVFEKVNLVVPVEQRRFFNYFNDTVTELEASYGELVFDKDKGFEPVYDIDDFCPIRPLYLAAIVDNILYFTSGQDTYKTEFIRKALEAYLRYWNNKSKGKRWGGREVTW